jgi:hypothetical protein
MNRLAVPVGPLALTIAGFAAALLLGNPSPAQPTRICSETCGPITTSRIPRAPRAPPTDDRRNRQRSTFALLS